MGSNQGTFIELEYPLVFGRCPGCGYDNVYSKKRLADYQKKGFILTSFCTICLFKRRAGREQAAMRPAAPVRPDAKATTMAVQHVATMTEAAPIAEEAEKIAATKAAEACLQVEEQQASVKAVKDAEEAAQAARKAKEEQAEKSAVIRAEIATAEAAKQKKRDSATKAKEAAAAKEAAKRQAAKDNETKLQAAKAKEEETRRAQEAEKARRAEQSSAAIRKAKDDTEAEKLQEDAKLAASKAEAEAIAEAIQEAEALSTASQIKTPSTPLEEHERRRRGSAMTGKEYMLLNAEKREKLLLEEGLLNLDPNPSEIDIFVRVDRYEKRSCRRGPLQVKTYRVYVEGSRGTRTLRERRTFHAQDLGFFYGAPTPEDDEDYASYSEKYGKEAHERHCEVDALYEARRDEEDRKLHELMQAKERELSTPTPLKCSRTAPTAPSPDSALYPPDSPPPSSLSGKDSENTKNRRPSSGPRETHSHSPRTAGISLPLADPLPLPNGTPVRKPIPLEGIARAH